MDIHQAVATLSNHNLNIRILNEKQDPELPNGTIVSQSPTSGTPIKPRQSVFLTLSKQPPIMKAPNCIGLNNDEITHHLNQLGLKSRIHTFDNTPYPKQSCFAQIPTPNSPLQGKTITLYQSSGQKKAILWPNFIGNPVNQIIEFLADHGIKPHITHYPPAKPGHTCDECTISDQRPLAGSLLILDENNPPYVQLRV